MYDANDYDLNKTAQVTNYADRVYEETLTALSGRYNAEIAEGNFDFVIDRSNSMLFPTTLTPVTRTEWWGTTEAKVTLSIATGANNSAAMDTALSGSGNDLNGLYYIIAQANSKATVFALWRSQYDGKWYCQDAAYYAQAQAGKAQFPDGKTADWSTYHGCCLDDVTTISTRGGDLKQDFTDAGSNSVPYTLYTGSPYTRLTWLKYDMSLIIYQLAAMNSNNTVTLTTFDADVRRCITRTLNSDANIQELISSVDNIQTDGGTAQNRGLQHVVGTYPGDKVANPNITCDGSSHLVANEKNYVVMITDGALNSKDTNAETSMKTAAGQIRSQGAKLMTVGLSMTEVTSAQKLLTEEQYGGIATNGLAFLDKNAREIASVVQNNIWDGLISLSPEGCKATVTDYISDSFYLVTPDGAPLVENDWITLSGTKATAGTADAAGQVCKDANGWYIKWENQTLPAKAADGSPVTPWSGKLYIKAKEDFIGGNAIDTNKSAEVSFLDGEGNTTATIRLDTPTVNVHLLPIGSATSEETVFLGDTVTPEARIKALAEQIQFSKIVPNSGDPVYNKSAAAGTDGLEDGSFTLAYAMGQLTDAQWTALLGGNEVKVDYTYDNASSHGAVGYFTLKLTKSGSGSQYTGHDTSTTGKAVETYTLTVGYTAYGLGATDLSGNSRPATNVHNGTPYGPGTEVGTGTVLGTQTSTNVHSVHVVDGKITVTKEIEPSLVDNSNPQTFTFTLQRLSSDGVTYEPVPGVTLDVTVGASQTSGTATLDTLPRGTYQLVEAASDDYSVKNMTVVDGDTNCQSSGSGTTVVTFTIGTDTDGENVIQTSAASPYSTLSGATPTDTNACKGVSYGTVEILNAETVYTAEIPVEKHWDQVPTDEYSGLTAYVALYQNDRPVQDAGGNVLALALNQGNNWQGSFTVALENKNQNVADLGYSIRELSGVTETGSGENHAIVTNEGAEANHPVVYYESAVASGLVKVGDKGYSVSLAVPDPSDYRLSVTNSEAYELPETGGPGTTLYTIGGLSLTAAGILLLYHKKKSGKEDFASS